jgi:hypothetical protein
VHGGASTSPDAAGSAWAEHYRRLRGHRYQPAAVRPTYFGAMPELARRWLLPGR